MTGLPAGSQRMRLVASGCLTAAGAALFAFVFFGLNVPPLDSSTLLNPPKLRPTTLTPVLTALPPTPRLYLEDNFSSKANWSRADNAGGATFAENGFLISPTADAQFTHVYLSSLKDESYRDISIQIEAKPGNGYSGVGYGVFFWHDQDNTGQERFIYFGVTTEGEYTLRAAVPVTGTIDSRTESRWVDLTSSIPSPVIRKGGAANRLRVDVHPGRILAFVNGRLLIDQENQVVDAFRNREDFDGKVGLLAYATKAGNPSVLFTLFDLYLDAKN